MEGTIPLKSVFETLNAINVNDKTEKKGKLTYLSWAWAWREVKKRYPEAFYTIYENAEGWNYFTDGRTAWVKTSVTIQGLEHIDYLCVMDNMQRSIPIEKVTSFDVTRTIQRSITKACARHGLGLYIYAGEDLPEGEDAPQNGENGAKKQQPHKPSDDLPFPDVKPTGGAQGREKIIKTILGNNEEYVERLRSKMATMYGKENFDDLNDTQFKTISGMANDFAKMKGL